MKRVKSHGVVGLADARFEVQWGTHKVVKFNYCWCSNELIVLVDIYFEG